VGNKNNLMKKNKKVYGKRVRQEKGGDNKREGEGGGKKGNDKEKKNVGKILEGIGGEIGRRL